MGIYNKSDYTYDLKKEIATKTFEIKTQVTAEQLENIIIDGFESGTNYWMGIDNSTEIWEDQPEDMPISQYAFQLLMDNKTVDLYDVEEEDDEGEKWQLTLEKLLKGISLNNINRPYDCNLESYDATTCDCIIQYALFDEVVYG